VKRVIEEGLFTKQTIRLRVHKQTGPNLYGADPIDNLRSLG